MSLLKSKKIIGTIGMLLILGCSKIYHKSELFLAKSNFDLNTITFRTDGYYYLERTFKEGEKYINKDVVSNSKSCGIMPLIFYSDGFVRKSEFIHGLKPFTTEETKKDSTQKSLTELENSFIDNSFHVQVENSIWDWGMYKQTKDEILIQYYSNHFGDYRLINIFGKVENDSTIVFKRKFGYEQPNYPYKINEELNEVYRFRKFHIKPDSTNYIRTNIHKFG